MFSLFTVGCPICNKPVVVATGASGALNYFPRSAVPRGRVVALLGYRAVPAVACDAVPYGPERPLTGATASSVWEEYA